MLEKPLVDSDYLLQRFPGKGGWTYAAIPEVTQNKSNPFGWVKVRGRIDSYELKQYKLMPMGNGKLFLPVKSEIRKSIQKQEGDYVRIVLYIDVSVLEIPNEIMDCFRNEANIIYKRFLSFSEGEQKAYLDWIVSAKREETKISRIAEMMNRLERNLKHNEKEILE